MTINRYWKSGDHIKAVRTILDDEEDMTKIFWDVKYSLIQAEIILKGLKRVHENMLKKMGITQKEMREYDAVMDSINLNYSEEVGKN